MQEEIFLLLLLLLLARGRGRASSRPGQMPPLPEAGSHHPRKLPAVTRHGEVSCEPPEVEPAGSGSPKDPQHPALA